MNKYILVFLLLLSSCATRENQVEVIESSEVMSKIQRVGQICVDEEIEETEVPLDGKIHFRVTTWKSGAVTLDKFNYKTNRSPSKFYSTCMERASEALRVKSPVMKKQVQFTFKIQTRLK